MFLDLLSLKSQDATEAYTFRIKLEKNNSIRVPFVEGGLFLKLDRIISSNEASVEIIASEEVKILTLRLNGSDKYSQAIANNVSISLLALNQKENVVSVRVKVMRILGEVNIHSSQTIELQVGRPYDVKEKGVILQLNNIEDDLKRVTVSLRDVTKENKDVVKETAEEDSYIFWDIFGSQGLQVKKISRNSVKLLMIQ